MADLRLGVGVTVARRSLEDRRAVTVVAALLVAALAAWAVALHRMAGMDAGPGTALGRPGWFIGAWATMMAAMMLPAVAPTVVLQHRTASRSPRGARTAAAFIAGYLLVWIAFGILAYGVQDVIAGLVTGFPPWDQGGSWVAGGAVVVAAAYQLSPLKQACLGHCRSPLHFLLGGWRPGVSGALRMGATHGLYCAGCCWALMVVLFAVGVMSVVWMVVVAAVVAAEKLMPGGERVSRAVAVGLLVLGVGIAIAPASVPGLTQPAGGMSMSADGAMPPAPASVR